MHKYFNFKQIFEAEQSGEPLNPEEMGTPTSQATVEEPTEKLEDFSKLALDYKLEIALSEQDIKKLNSGESVTKEDSKWKRKTNETDFKDVKKVILNTSNSEIEGDPEALLLSLDSNVIEEITEGLKLGNVEQVLNGIAKDLTPIKKITVKFIKSVEPDTSDDTSVVPASTEQIKSGAVAPDAVASDAPNEATRIMSFDQFVNEGKKNWIAGVVKDMDKGALKKELGGKKVTKAKIAKEEAKLKKKDTDKKKPGLQLKDPKDAKTHKRDVLALNLLNAQKGKK
jgi:hypothetical protein